MSALFIVGKTTRVAPGVARAPSARDTERVIMVAAAVGGGQSGRIDEPTAAMTTMGMVAETAVVVAAAAAVRGLRHRSSIRWCCAAS